MALLHLTHGSLDLSFPQIMGILNVTPDSFSDGGSHPTVSAAIDHCARMIAEGAAIIDIGGESTRPGAAQVTVQEEMDRVLPVTEVLRARFEVPISLDTSTPEVMQAGIQAGADLINDVRSLTRPGALETAAALQVPVCIMHMQGDPQTMQVKDEFREAINRAKEHFKSKLTHDLTVSLAEAAKGYEREETETEYVPNPNGNGSPTIRKMRKKHVHYQPNVAAAIFLLTNLDPEHYQNRQRSDMVIKKDEEKQMTIEEINAEIARLEKLDKE